MTIRHALPQDAKPRCMDDPERMFPTGVQGTGAVRDAAIRRAKAVCVGCPFIDPCLAYSLRWIVEGVWAGTTERERDQMRAEHGIDATPLPPLSPSSLGLLAEHGTPARYRRHLRDKEHCQVCVEAYRRYQNPSQRNQRTAS